MTPPANHMPLHQAIAPYPRPCHYYPPNPHTPQYGTPHQMALPSNYYPQHPQHPHTPQYATPHHHTPQYGTPHPHTPHQMALPSHYYPPHSHTPQYGTQRINMNAQYAVTPRINVNEQHLQHLQQQIGPIWSNDPNQTQTTNNNQTRPNAEQFATDTPGGRDTLPTGTATGNPSAPMDTDTPDGRDTMQNEIDTATD
eukprot:120856_1